MKIDKRTLMPAGIVLAGVTIAGALVTTGGSASKAVPVARTLLVETIQPTPEDIPIPVRGTGVVTAAQQISLVPQVSGQIVETDPRLMPGGRFKAGEVIARIDARDYLAMRDQAQSQAQRALEPGPLQNDENWSR